MSSTTQGNGVGDAGHFWTALFDQEQLAGRLDQVVSDPGPKLCHLVDYGDVQLTAQSATKVGDGFMSDAFLVTATTKATSFSAFVKVMPRNPFLRASAVDQRLYDREVGIYGHFLPLLSKLRAQKALVDWQVPLNVPRVFYTKLSAPDQADTTPSVLVMEDLKGQGFAMADKVVCCSLEQARATVSSLASFHALSIAVTRQWRTGDGDLVLPEALGFIWDKALFDAKGPEMLGPAIPLHCEIMRRLGHPEAADWLRLQAEDIVDIMSPEDVRQCGPLACLLHADCWINNVMFRKRETVQMRMVDWQITRMGHAVTDVLHFLFSSTTPELRADHFDSLTFDYFHQLKDDLSKLDIDLEQEGYGEDRFRSDVKKRLRWALFLCLMMFPVMLDDSMTNAVENYDDQDLDNLEANKSDRSNVFGGMKDKMKEIFNIDNMMKKQVLCHRISKLILEVKSALDQ